MSPTSSTLADKPPESHPPNLMDSHDDASHEPLRWPRDWMTRRRAREAGRAARHPPVKRDHRVHLPLPYRVLRLFLKATGLYGRGIRNFLDIRIHEVNHFIPGWPAAAEPITILHLSDLHLDLDMPRLLPVILENLYAVRCDLAVLTGDYLECPQSGHAEALEGMGRILDALGEPPLGRFGVLGNHDSLAFARDLEALNLPILVSEARVCETGGGPLAVAGVDDAYLFDAADVAAAAAACPARMPALLLSHSPQVAMEARRAGFSLMLSGHTHGGQVCLPGGHSLVPMEDIPPPLYRGRWRIGPLHGYTTTGTGSSHLPVRFHCPPEIVLHHVHAPDS